MRISDEPLFKTLFGSKVKQNVLRFLYTNQSPSSEREIARVIHKSHTAVNKAMKELLDINAVECFSVGKAIIWGINKESFTYPHIKYLLETFTKTPLDIIKSEVASMLAARIRYMDPYTDMKAIPTIMEAYIFGSFAKGISRSDSDIDILLIVESVCNKEELAKALQESVGESLSKKIGNFISFHIYSKSEVDKNNPHWLKAAIESGIKVYE